MTDNHGLPRKGYALLVSPADQHEQELLSDSLFNAIKQVLVSLSYIELDGTYTSVRREALQSGVLGCISRARLLAPSSIYR